MRAWQQRPLLRPLQAECEGTHVTWLCVSVHWGTGNCFKDLKEEVLGLLTAQTLCNRTADVGAGLSQG